MAACNLCRNKRDRKAHIMLHNYPTRRSDRLRKWKTKIKEAYSSVANFKLRIRDQSKICSRHFVSNDFVLIGEGKIALSPEAVPTVFSDVHKYVPPRSWYNPCGDSSDEDQNNLESSQKTHSVFIEAQSDNNLSANESLLISNRQKTVEAICADESLINEPDPESSAESNEMPAIGIIVRENDLEVVEINRNKMKCQLCDEQMPSYKLVNVLKMEKQIQKDLIHLFQRYFELRFKPDEKISVCRICMQKCKDIVDLKFRRQE